MSIRLLVVSICSIFAVLSYSSPVWACTCLAKPTVLDAFEDANLVVTVRLASVEKIGEKQREYDIHYIRSATMVVDKVYKGEVKPGTTLKLAQGGGADCIWTFDEEDVGKQYLFYLGTPSNRMSFGEGVASATVINNGDSSSVELMYYASGCGRSTGLRGAADDLAYLDNVSKVRGKTRLSGTFGVWFNYGFDPSNIKIKIIGKNKTFEAKTNKDGFFEIYDLPPGDFAARIETPFGWKINDYMVRKTSTGFSEFDPAGERRSANEVPVRIVEGRHAALDMIFDIDTAIKGRVLSPTGKPMKDVCVMAVSTELAEGDHRGHSDCTNEKGEFVIDEMAPGNYRLVANYRGLMNANAPFGMVFYPGVTERANAGIVAVEPGRSVTERVIQITQTVDLVSFKGRFVFSDGKPLADEWVKFVPNDMKRFDDMSQKTDTAGNFEFRLPKGATGKIFGEFHTYTGEFRNCSKLEEIIKATGKEFYNAKSDVVEVNSLEPKELVEITLPFPFCQKAKE